MRYLKSLTFFLALLFGVDALAQSSPQTITRIRDGAMPTTYAGVQSFDLTYPVADIGLQVLAGIYFFNGANMYRWNGGVPINGTLNVDVTAPFVQGFNFSYSTTNGRWQYLWSVDGSGGGISTNADATVVNGLNFYYDTDNSRYLNIYGTEWDNLIAVRPGFLTYNNPNINAFGVFNSLDAGAARKWDGEIWDGSMAGTVNPNVNAFGVFRDTSNNLTTWWNGPAWGADMALSSPAPNVNSLNVFHDVDNNKNIWLRGETYDSSIATTIAPLHIGLTAFHNGTTPQYWLGSVLSSEFVDDAGYAPHSKTMLHGYDVAAPAGQEWKYINMLATQADGQVASLNSLVVSNLNYAYNGASFDMLRIGASNELQVTDVATRPGEDAGNDWRKVKKEQTATYTPAYTDTAIVGGAGLTTIMSGTEVISDVNWCVYVKNTDGADAFTDAAIDTSADNSSWAPLTWTNCDTLAAGATCVYCTANSAYRYIRVQAASASDTSARVWYTSNKN